jgi:hypothetical protein
MGVTMEKRQKDELTIRLCDNMAAGNLQGSTRERPRWDSLR